MKFQTFKPSRQLTTFVKSFWTLESDQPYTHYSMADVCPELLFHFRGQFDELHDSGKKEKSFTAGIHGQTRITRKFQISQGFGIFGVSLYPQAIPLLFGIPTNEISNYMPDLNILLKAEGDELEEKIATASDNFQRKKIIEDFIESKLSQYHKEQLPVFSCINAIIENRGQTKVRQLANDCFISERQFERQFLKFSGFTPKLFSRIVRFQSVLSKYQNVEKSLTVIALDAGYYDQSHFVHDFKEFSGHLPKDYFSGNSDVTKWRNQ
ncbi:DUF6597 domain-containing transcriptional factor [Ulvibacterium sp.]|uniref:DUF6597 domain-containing transcriptional factor n=1 Tax=Ulvibacterium sp. TaxID=2665914 RepID=UPI003BAAB830